MSNPVASAWQLAFEISPIMLVGGVIPGGMLPIVAIMQSGDFLQGVLGGSLNLDLDNFFAHFSPLPGSTLIEYQNAKYPFANQAVAANAVIAQPLTISLLMKCPATGAAGYPLKLAVMSALKATLDYHISQGGTFTVSTPSYIYTNCLLLALRDASDTSSKQVQNTYQWDFEAPLLTLGQLQSVMGNLMSQITSGTQITGQPAWSGLGPTVAQPNSLAGPGLLPSTSGLPGAITSPAQVQPSGLPIGG